MKLSKGFTLLEIVITISIVTLVATFGFIGFNQLGQSQEFNTTFDELMTTVQEARSSTLSQVDAESVCTNSSSNLVGYQISVDSESEQQSYQLDIVCGDVDDSMTWNETMIRKINIPSDLSISSEPENATVFRVPNALTATESQISLSSDESFEQIIISTSGAILRL